MTPRKPTIADLQRQVEHWQSNFYARVTQAGLEKKRLLREIQEIRSRALDAEAKIARIRRLWNGWLLINKGVPEGQPATVQLPSASVTELLFLLRMESCDQYADLP